MQLKIIVLILLLLAGGSHLAEAKSKTQDNDLSPINISIIADPHYFNPSLGTGGSCFNDYLKKDRKMIAESDAIINSAIESLKNDDSDIILIPGDLTKDGELVSHKEFAEKLRLLEKSGKKVFVIPGNHDLNNPEAFTYSGDTCFRTESVSPEEFIDIYHDFGYGEAFAKDPNSLTYFAEAQQGLWILGIDDNKYDKNYKLGKEEVGGRIKESTVIWIEDHLKEAQKQGIMVVAMMHHGLLEHFEGQKQIFNDYVIDDWKSIAKRFALAGLQIVFSGHFHAQDISSMHLPDGSFIYDIQTGSLLTYPCPYRKLTINERSKGIIETKHIESIEYDLDGIAFQDYAKDFLRIGIENIAGMLLDKFGMSEVEKDNVMPLIIEGLMDHYTGDESADEDMLKKIEELKQSKLALKQLIGKLLSSICVDLPPADNNLEIDLESGTAVQLTHSIKRSLKN